MTTPLQHDCALPNVRQSPIRAYGDGEGRTGAYRAAQDLPTARSGPPTRILTAGNSVSASNHVAVECHAIRPEDQRLPTGSQLPIGKNLCGSVRRYALGTPWDAIGVHGNNFSSGLSLQFTPQPLRCQGVVPRNGMRKCRVPINLWRSSASVVNADSVRGKRVGHVDRAVAVEVPCSQAVEREIESGLGGECRTNGVETTHG